MATDDSELKFEINMDTSTARKELQLLNKESLDLGNTIKSAFENIAIKGRDVEDVFKSLALQISKRSFSKAFAPVEGLFDNLLGGSGTMLGNVFGFAKGGVISGHTGLSGGGVLSSPATFPLGGSATGLAGEAGPEAIMPLARGPNGELGIRASGEGPVNVTINISTPDVESFRRSEGEIAARLQQIVSRGNRNL
jgi:phage-related minor tail protein